MTQQQLKLIRDFIVTGSGNLCDYVTYRERPVLRNLETRPKSSRSQELAKESTFAADPHITCLESSSSSSRLDFPKKSDGTGSLHCCFFVLFAWLWLA